MNNFDRGPGRHGRDRRPHGDMTFVILIIKAVVEVVTFVVKSIIAVIAGSKLRDAVNNNENKTAFDAAFNEAKKPKSKNKKRISAVEIIAIVFGIIFGFVTVVNACDLLFDPIYGATLSWGIDVVVPLIISLGAFGFWRSRKSFTERQSMYRILIGDADYFDLSALAAAANVSKRRVKRDIKKMISKGDFGNRAYIDMGSNILFRTPEAGAEYAKAHSSEHEKKNADAAQADTAFDDEKQATDRVVRDEYREIILEIRRLNDEIEDLSVSERIYRIEEHTQNIFDYVKEHPEKKEKIRTFMNYYLPTTLKLLTSYAKIERLGASGDNMKNTKDEIEKTLDMLVYAFDRELDILFESESIDISSDIDVLETMLKRDGMTRGYSDDLFSGGAAADSSPADTGQTDTN